MKKCWLEYIHLQWKSSIFKLGLIFMHWHDKKHDYVTFLENIKMHTMYWIGSFSHVYFWGVIYSKIRLMLKILCYIWYVLGDPRISNAWTVKSGTLQMSCYQSYRLSLLLCYHFKMEQILLDCTTAVYCRNMKDFN